MAGYDDVYAELLQGLQALRSCRHYADPYLRSIVDLAATEELIARGYGAYRIDEVPWYSFTDGDRRELMASIQVRTRRLLRLKDAGR